MQYQVKLTGKTQLHDFTKALMQIILDFSNFLLVMSKKERHCSTQ